MLDPKDVAYLGAGLALMGLTTLPLVTRRKPVSIPALYVLGGIALTLTPWALPLPDPRVGEMERFLIDHLTELIVIIALATGGLSVDRRGSWGGWQHAIALLAVTMPLTIAAVYVMGTWAGLSTGAAMLLAASLAPTDPVLARSVAVEGPNVGDEDDVRVSLTVEAGLNDGLAFPFVWLAIALTAIGATSLGQGLEEVWRDWLTFDVAWRIMIACIVGTAVGWGLARLVMGRFGDASEGGGSNAGLVFLGTTFVAYGATEALEGYGFLAVFLAARAGRALTRKHGDESYVRKPHGFGDQVEKVLLAVLLFWLGGMVATGMLSGLRLSEVGIALALIFVIRPVVGYLPLIPTRGDRFQKLAIAAFGIRGMGSFFYLAFATGHAEYGAEVDTLWRIVTLVVLISIVIHGTLAPIAMRSIDARAKAATG